MRDSGTVFPKTGGLVRLGQRLCKYFSHMAGANGCQVADLLATTRSGGHHDRSERLCAHLLDQGFCDLQRKLIVLFQCAKGTRHSAAARIQQGYLALGESFGYATHEVGATKRLSVAVSVNDNPPGFGPKIQGARLAQ